MSSVHWWCAVLLLCPVAEAGAQSLPSRPAPLSPISGPDVVVKGGPEKRSDWKRVESDHIVVTGKGSDAELKQISVHLEQLYQLLSRLYRQGDTADVTVKLRVTLADRPDFFRTMGLRNLRTAEGPFVGVFSGERYYDPRDDGSVMMVSHADQVVDLNTTLIRDADVSASFESGGDGTQLPYHVPVVRPWEAVLYSVFAQHFILTYLPAAYPRWYMDGIGALFSTIAVRRDGGVDYARAPFGYTEVFRAYGEPNVADLLSGRTVEGTSSGMHYTPYHAWALAHFFLFSALKPERSHQFQAYMAAIRRGTPIAEAAKLFGDMRRLQREVAIYIANRTSFARADPPQAPGPAPLIVTLSQGNAAVIDADIELDTRLAALPDAGDGWFAQLRDTAARYPNDADAMLVAAEAECRTGHSTACLADAEHVLTNTPDDVRALAWKGMALTDQAIAGSAAGRAQALAAARHSIERAASIDEQAPLPRIAWFQSFTRAGEPVPEQGLVAMAKVVRMVPAAPGPRLYLAEELVRQGKADLARRLLYPVLYGAYDSPEKSAAQTLFASAVGGH